MLLAALTQPVRRRQVAAAASGAYAISALAAGSLSMSFWANLLAPGGLLLCGYWLSGLAFHTPQPWLEAWLLRTDAALGAPRWMGRMPAALRELLEVSYTADYVVVGGGALYAATAGLDAVAYYWSLVLTSELASFAPLPWLRSRPPRLLEAGRPQGAGAGSLNRPAASTALHAGATQPAASWGRRLNLAILNNASVQANTLPSGHVSGAVAAALGVMSFDAVPGWCLMAMAVAISAGAVAGRYHYAVDCVTGAAVALLVWAVI